MDDNSITIVTEIPRGGKDIQTLHITHTKLADTGKAVTFFCLSKDKRIFYKVEIPEAEKVEYIDVFIPQQQLMEAHHYRILVD